MNCLFSVSLEPDLFPGLFAVIFSVAATAGFACVFAMERSRRYRLELSYRACMLFCLCGVTAIGMAASNAAASNDAGLELFTSYALVYSGYSLVQPTMWMLALGYVFLRKEQSGHVVGLVFAGQYLGFFVGTVLVELAKAASLGPAAQETAPTLVFGCILALAVAYLAIFPERELLGLSPLMFGMSHESVDARSEQIAREYGLTPRETEVFALLARGRDITYVVTELGISKNTANVHRKNIYVKLDVHSQQDLLSLVEEPAYDEAWDR